MKRITSRVAVSLLALCITASARSATTADIVFVVDESGSMSGEHGWIGSMVAGLDTALINAGVTNNRFGLVGFGGGGGADPIAGHQHLVAGGQFGTAANLTTAIGSLVTSGGTEDGYSGIAAALAYSFRPGAAVNMILITDEDRDVANAALTFNSTKASLIAVGGLLNAIVDATLGTTPVLAGGAIGHDAKGVAYVADGAGGFTTHVAGSASGAGSTIADYYNLATQVGGAVWDLNKLRAGGLTATSFTNAFVNAKVQEIVIQPTTVPETGTTASLLAFALGALLLFRRRFSA